MSHDPVAFKKTKHILRAAEFLRDLVAREVITLRHLPGRVMIADLLTKAPARVVFTELMRLVRTFHEGGGDCMSLFLILWPLRGQEGLSSGMLHP